MLQSDAVVHRLIAEDAEVRAALEARFGTTDRAKIAAVVFADLDELAWLEGLLHPRVRREVAAWRAALELRQAPPDVYVVEIPLLYEGGSEGDFDVVVVITAPADVRAARAGRIVDERSARLIPDDEKVCRADFAYVNDGTLADLEAFVRDVLTELRR